VIEEEADAAAAFKGREDEIARPDEAQWPAWSGYLQRAWETLRDDRHYGAMGGLGRIYFTAIERYAARYGIAGSDFDDLLLFLHALDDEYIACMNEKTKAETDKNKAPR
jgi:hypothetical protein